MKNAAELSELVSKMVKTINEKQIDMKTDLTFQIIKERVLPAEWELSSIIKSYEVKCDTLVRGNYGGLILTDQILEIVERIIKKMIRQLVDIQLDFIPGMWVYRCLLDFQTVAREILS